MCADWPDSLKRSRTHASERLADLAIEMIARLGPKTMHGQMLLNKWHGKQDKHIGGVISSALGKTPPQWMHINVLKLTCRRRTTGSRVVKNVFLLKC